jgi:tripartite-type tricarboxylate transporter receptor subunit TctC
MYTRNPLVRSFAVAALVMGVVPTVGAETQTWPDRPVKIIVGFPAGGGTDIIARILADRLGEAFGHRFIVENRVGATGSIAAEAVARSTPDGHTVLISAADVATNKSVMKTMSYDPVTDLAPITLIGWTPLLIIANSDLNVSTPAELIVLLRTTRGQLSYASPGRGSPHHMAGEYLKKVAGVEMQAVHYRGIAPALQDVLAGHVPITVSGIPPIVELIRSGRLRAIAFTSGKRSSLFPNTPPLAELGPEYKDFDFTNWFGLFTPAGVPEAIQERLHDAAVKALADPGVFARITEQGAEVVGNTRHQFREFFRAEVEKYARMSRATGIAANP